MYKYYIFWFETTWRAGGFPGGSAGKNLPRMQETQETGVRSLGRKDPLEEEMAIHYSILAGKVPWIEDPCGLRSMGSKGVGHD